MIVFVALSNFVFLLFGLLAIGYYLLETKVKGWKTNYYLFIFIATQIYTGITPVLNLRHPLVNQVLNIAGFTSLIIFIVKMVRTKSRKSKEVKINS